MHYVTSFEIKGTDQTRASRLLKDVRELVETELEESSSGSKDWDVEFGDIEEASFAEISAERLYQEHTIRLELRLCTQGEALYAEIRTRFLMTSAGDQPNLVPRPTRLLRMLTGAFHCVIGDDNLSHEALTVTEQSAPEYVDGNVTSPDRQLPILAISANPNGDFALDPNEAQEQLLGLAMVVAYDVSSQESLNQLLSSTASCYNGSIRILWPGCRTDANGPGPRTYRAFSSVSKRFLPDIQRTCIDQAPESDFGRWFNEAKVKVIEEQLRLERIKKQASYVPTTEARKSNLIIKQLQRKNDELNEAIAAKNEEIANRDEELQEKTDIIAQLQRELETPEDLPGELTRLRKEARTQKETISKLKKTNDSLNKDNQFLKEKNQALENSRAAQEGFANGDSDSGARIVRLGDSNLDNVTILNYAINIFRDEMRSVIAGGLSQKEIQEIMRHLGVEDAPYEDNMLAFKTALDITGETSGSCISFEYAVSKFQNRFPKDLAQRLQQIRSARNKAAHPPPVGLLTRYTEDWLHYIAETLDSVQAPKSAIQVKDLASQLTSA